jgi:photosystem II stability/assembly factor-like uncharacterized protein
VEAKCQWLNTFWPVGVQCFGNLGTKIFAGNGSKLIVSNDSGITWTNLNTAPTTHYYCVASTDTILFAGTDSGVYKSKDEGSTWSKTSSGLPDYSIASLAFNNTYLFAGIRGRAVYRSSDSGNTWVQAYNGLYNGLDDVFVSIDNFAQLGNSLFVGVYQKGIYSTTDNGDNWFRVLTDTTLSGQSDWYITAIEGNLYATASHASYFLLSTDNGISWKTFDMGNFGFDGTAQAAIVAIGSNVFIGFTDPVGGITQSTDAGKTWSTIGTMHRVNSLFIFGDYIFAGTNNTGLYRARLSDFGVDVVSSPSKNNSKFTIIANPTSSFADFQFDALKEASVFELFDLLGRSLKRQQLSAGQASLHVDMQNYPPGIYFARFGGETVRFVKKM